MSAEEKFSFGELEITELNRILEKIIARETPTDEELEFLQRLRIQAIDPLQHSRRIDG
jgi:hypothetical protein